MHLLECVFTLVSSPLRAILLLSFSSPRRGIPPLFYRYRERARGWLVLEIYCEESRDVVLVSRYIHVLECFSFNTCCIRVNI